MSVFFNLHFLQNLVYPFLEISTKVVPILDILFFMFMKFVQKLYKNWTIFFYRALIRFYEISSKDYINKVRPYEEILSKELRDDVLKFHMIPGYKPTFNTYTPRYS